MVPISGWWSPDGTLEAPTRWAVEPCWWNFWHLRPPALCNTVSHGWTNVFPLKVIPRQHLDDLWWGGCHHSRAPNDNRARLGCCQRSRASVKYVQTTHQWRNTCSVQNRWSWMKPTLHCNTRAHPCNYINTLSEGNGFVPLSTVLQWKWFTWQRYCKCLKN